MRTDLILGVLLSLLLHAGLGLGDRFFKPAPPPEKAVAGPPPLEVMIQPLIEPDEPPLVDVAELDAAPASDASDIPAPPMQADVPTVNVHSPFVQQLQPVLPRNPAASSAAAIRIPTVRPTGNVRAQADRLFDLASLDQVPVPTFRALPIHPYDMQRAGVSGHSVVEFIVDAAGRVSDARAVSSSRREFEAPAVQAVLRWKFRPGRKGGMDVSTRMQVSIAFDLNPS